MRAIHFPSLTVRRRMAILSARLGRLLPLALVLALAACGVTTTGDAAGRRVGGTPTTSTATRPGGTPVPSVPPTDAITLTTDHASYTTSGHYRDPQQWSLDQHLHL